MSRKRWDENRQGGRPGRGAGQDDRFWEGQRLLPPPARTPAGYREYDPAALERLAFIWHAQVAGLTLEAICQVLDIRDGGQPPCLHVTGLIARRLSQVEAGRRSRTETECSRTG